MTQGFPLFESMNPANGDRSYETTALDVAQLEQVVEQAHRCAAYFLT
jgi:hypothetical protein